MNAIAIAPPKTKRRRFTAHRAAVLLLACALSGFVICSFVQGWSYYKLPVDERPFHTAHRELRPAGAAGISFGIISASLLAAIYMYPLRKRIGWLKRIGTTRNWLDFHIVMGLSSSFLVALHSAFKFRGIAGMAFWIMNSVVASGIVGRYLYAQIPRSRKDAEISHAELERMRLELGDDLRGQTVIPEAAWRPLVTPVRRDETLRSALPAALARMLILDLARPLQMAALRRKGLSPAECFWTLGGLLASSHADLERVVGLARRQSWLTAKICFLDRAGEIFKLWHVVHRPFSYALLILLTLHIGMVTWMGFF
jgi:hypothetical protein